VCLNIFLQHPPPSGSQTMYVYM